LHLSFIFQAWLNDHDKGEFGLFIDGKWVKPDGRKTYQTKNPATGKLLVYF
jgi:aldehyde dehydrogenase (NAD+)